MPAQEARIVTVADGRRLGVHDAGDPDGPAILVHHGTPSDGLPFEPWVQDAVARGARLIGYDRPGYGASTPHPGRTVADAAADVAALARELGIDRLRTWGISGGAPHALACAALLPGLVVAAASLAAVAPFDADGLNFFAGMGRENWVELGAALQGREAIEALAGAQAEGMRDIAPDDLAGMMATLVSPVDRASLDSGLAGHWAAAGPRTFAQGAQGWVDDDLAFIEPFGFDPAAIAVPVLVWHGRHDRFVPVAHGEWYAARVPGADARITDDDGHLTLITERVPDVHAWLLAH